MAGDGKWRWYSQGLYGKTALDYLTDVRGYGLVDAVCLLIGEQPHGKERSDRPVNKAPTQKITPQAQPPPERAPFAIPRHHKNNDRVIAYCVTDPKGSLQ